MDERFPDEFVTWHHGTPVGVKIDEIFGMDNKSGKVWLELARQIFCEQGQPDYRIIDHFPNGAPFIEGYPGRISLSHTNNFLVVAMLPKTPELNLEIFNTRSAMGIDAERLDRQQVIKIREKFLSQEELKLIPEDNLKANIIAWTSKEALYKAAFTTGLDFKDSIHLIKLPSLSQDPLKKDNDESLGEASVSFPESSELGTLPFILYSYESYGCCVTIALSPKCAKFGKMN